MRLVTGPVTCFERLAIHQAKTIFSLAKVRRHLLNLSTERSVVSTVQVYYDGAGSEAGPIRPDRFLLTTVYPVQHVACLRSLLIFRDEVARHHFPNVLLELEISFANSLLHVDETLGQVFS